MMSMATVEKSYNCLEGSSLSVADNYIIIQDNIPSGLEGAGMENKNFVITSDGLKNKRKRANGYWNTDSILKELKDIISGLAHFPTCSELIEMDRYDLVRAIQRNGRTYKFRDILGYSHNQKPHGYWIEENILVELKGVISKLGHFPTQLEMKKLNKGLSDAIKKNGGINKFRTMLGYELIVQKPHGYWTDDNIVKELEDVILELGHFPTCTELREIDKCDLMRATDSQGGLNKFRTIMGYELVKKPNMYWTEENTIKELKNIISRLNHFPKHLELKEMNRTDLITAMVNNGGINKYRDILGYKYLHKSNGYWTLGNTERELQQVINKLGCFPTAQELEQIGRYDLINAIANNGGFNKFRMLLGYPVSFYEKHQSKISSYLNKKGKGSERLVKDILVDWCKENNHPLPEKNVKLAKGNVIEFVCQTGKRVGIDVTNTKWGTCIRRKWTHKEYHKHLDELWVVVFSSGIRERMYRRWNEESPDNVKIMDVFSFLEELDYAADAYIRTKINDYINCSFHTKSELKTKYDCGSVQTTFETIGEHHGIS